MSDLLTSKDVLLRAAGWLSEPAGESRASTLDLIERLARELKDTRAGLAACNQVLQQERGAVEAKERCPKCQSEILTSALLGKFHVCANPCDPRPEIDCLREMHERRAAEKGWPSPDETAAEPTGTFECPVCGKAEPHQHPAHSIRWLSDHVQKFTDSISDPNVMPHYWSRQHAPDGDNVRFYAPPVQARWEAYCSAVKASETDLTLPQGDPQMRECQHDMSQQSPSELPVMRDRAQGVDCYWCEDGIPHRHEPSGPVCICPEAIDAATNPACPMHGFAVNGTGD